MDEPVEMSAEAPAKRGPGRPPKEHTQARNEAAFEAVPEPAPIPDGHDVCFVAIPGKVSRGSNAKGVSLGKADFGDKIIAPTKTINELELRGLAFRDEDEAKGAYRSYQRKVEDAKAKALAALKAKEERAKQSALAQLGYSG